MMHLLAECDTVELVEHGFVEALADTVGLRALGLGACDRRLSHEQGKKNDDWDGNGGGK
jgi:hypothetical protein